MKFMKLGTKPDSFQTDGNDVRIVGTELASDIIIHVGDVNFHLHKFPLLSKCGHIQKLLSSDTSEEIHVKDVPGGATSFEICAKFCYGISTTLNPHNVIATRCAAEFLEMSESIEKRNLIYKVDVFLSSSVFKGWKDSIIALQTMKTLKPWTEDLKLVKSCMDAISSKASADVARVDWSYTYNRKKLVPNEVPKDWFVEDLTEIELDYFKNIITAIKMKGRVSHKVVGEAIKAYTYKRVPSLSRVSIIQGDLKVKSLVETITLLLPSERSSVSCSFLLKLLRAACMLKCSETCKKELVKRIGKQLEEASVNDLLIPTMDGEVTVYDIDVVLNIVEEFVMQDDNKEEMNGDVKEMEESGVILRNSKGLVAKLVDGYLAEVAKDPNMPLSKFLDLAEMVSSESRPIHDGLYRAIDMFLKEHPDITKSEKKKLCTLLDCKRLSADASAHAVQNERLPLRLVVQVLFLEQSRSSSSSASASATSYGSSRSITTTNVTSEDDNWDGTGGVIIDGKVVKDVYGLNGGINQDNKVMKGINGLNGVNDIKVVKSVNGINGGVNGVKKIIGKIMQGRGSGGVSSGSDSSGSPDGSSNKEEAVKATPGRSVRYSVS
ncbi:hypothetical protein LUZ60_005974 [Juncus effusus]|nr:hypothetical protein LUZ60_005974 [Juncus effusus]